MQNTEKKRGGFIYNLLLGLMMSMLVVSISGCDDDDGPDVSNPSGTVYDTPKYIFFFIGDGMASPQVNLTEAALADPDFRLADGAITLGAMNLQQFPVAGMATTHAEDRYITGSAAAATALATGHKTTIGTISKNADRTQNLKTMAQMAKEKGMKVGIVSSVSIDHATPACFYAHEDSRGNYYDIAAQMATSGFDYFGGGYAKGNFSKYQGRANNFQGDIETLMKNAGYNVVDNLSGLRSAQPGEKCWAYTGYDGSAALYYEVDRVSTDHVSLAEFTEEGIRLLDNPDGFFMMVEGGKVDWACHANDAVSATHDMVAFDEAIGKAIEFYNQHPKETLIIVTGDHECGGLSLGYAATGYESAFDLLKHQEISYQEFTEIVKSWKGTGMTFENALESAKTYFGLGDGTITNNDGSMSLALTDYDRTRLSEAFDGSMNSVDRTDEEIYLKYGPYYDPFTVTITHILNEKAGISWTSYYHTGVPVPVYAIGEGALVFSGSYDNTDIAKKIMEVGSLN